MSSNNIITAKNLSIAYHDNAIWKDANFVVEKGKFVGVLGPNGSGKTTLFKLLLGLSDPTSGELRVLGKEPQRGNPRIGYVPQRHHVDSDMTIEALEMVRIGLSGNKFGMSLSPEKERKMAYEALVAVEAEGLAHRPIGKLSGGELQRVFLAEALISKPDLLLLDEPLANLDIRRETNLIELVNQVVKSQGVTALLIAHNINPLLPVLDSVIYIAEGKIATGTPNEIFTSEKLTSIYGTPVEVLRDSRGRVAILGVEEQPHHDE